MANFFRKYEIAILAGVVLVLFVYVGVHAAFVGPTTGSGVGSGFVGVDTSGNVSFGTSTPFGNTKVLIISSSLVPTDFALKVLQPNGSPLLLVRNDGGISIGTSTITAGSLTVAGNIYANGTFTGTVMAGNITSGVFDANGGNGSFAFPSSLGIATSSQVGLPQPLSVYGNGYLSGNLGIGTSTPANLLTIATSSPIFTVAASGNVGIGTANPTQALTMNGGTLLLKLPNAKIDTPAATIGAVAAGSASTTNTLDVKNNLSVGGGLTVGTGGINSAGPIVATGISLQSALDVKDSLGNSLLAIRNDGRAGIGTANPQAKLHIAGGDVYVRNQGSGIILQESDGTNCRRITFDNAGTISASAAFACP